MAPKDKNAANEETQRYIVVGREDKNRCDNKISTSKYNIFTFLPVVRTFYVILGSKRVILVSWQNNAEECDIYTL